MKGRPPKTIDTLKLQGTVRRDRHSKRAIEPQSGGKPQPPTWLQGEALKFWKETVPKLDMMGILQSIDSVALAALCRWWAEWRKTDRELEEEIDSKNRFKLTILAGMSWKQFDKLATKFGLTPVDRVKLATAEPEKDDDPLDAILRARAGMN